MLTAATALERAHEVRIAALADAEKNDAEGRFPVGAMKVLASSGLLGLTVAKDLGGSGEGPRTFSAVVGTLAEADPSLAMIYVMHVSATCVFAASNNPAAKAVLRDIAAGKHLTTLAFSEKGSRSHFWAPVSKAKQGNGGLLVNAYKSWVTSAGHADSYVVSCQSATAGTATDTLLCWVTKDATGVRVAGPWVAMGMRSNAAAPVVLEDALVPPGQMLADPGTGFKAMLEVVLPWFCLGQASTSLGICRATVANTVTHLKTARFDHMAGTSLGEALPNLRANLAKMQIATDGLAARLTDFVGHLEVPSDATMLRVLESKASAAETAIAVTQTAMTTCGGAAFSKHTSIERYFRDAQASAVMAPTSDVLHEFIGKALLGIPLF